jgi:hypothetical protein
MNWLPLKRLEKKFDFFFLILQDHYIAADRRFAPISGRKSENKKSKISISGIRQFEDSSTGKFENSKVPPFETSTHPTMKHIRETQQSHETRPANGLTFASYDERN